MNHIAQHPRDVLAVSAAVPTIAFSGVTDVQQEAWELVEGLAPAYGDHWWYISLLAFTRQDQSRFDEAGLLAESALSCEPTSGHAVHAQTHVLYETGEHEHRPGLARPLGRGERPRGQPPRALLLARRAARARARRHRGGPPALLHPARAADRHRRPGADRLRLAAVALAGHHVRLGRRRRRPSAFPARRRAAAGRVRARGGGRGARGPPGDAVRGAARRAGAGRRRRPGPAGQRCAPTARAAAS